MLSDELKQTRQKLGMTQGQLAERLGVALNTVSRWENGTSKPEGEGMIRLALRQLEQESLFNDSALMQQIQAKIDMLQTSKTELESLVNKQLAAEKKIASASKRSGRQRAQTSSSKT